MSWDKKQQALYMREYNARKKKAAYALLGDKCIKCGFNDPRALQIDHVVQRSTAENKKATLTRYLQLLNGKRAQELQLLCANCNAIKVWENDERARRRKY